MAAHPVSDSSVMAIASRTTGKRVEAMSVGMGRVGAMIAPRVSIDGCCQSDDDLSNHADTRTGPDDDVGHAGIEAIPSQVLACETRCSRLLPPDPTRRRADGVARPWHRIWYGCDDDHHSRGHHD